MADSGINITEGSGQVVDTRTEATNGQHRQVVILGDPATNAGVAPVDATAGLKVDLGADNDVTVAGVSTAANQTTIIGHLDGVEGLLTTIDTDTGAIATSVANIDTDTTTIIGHLDGVETLLGTIDADTGGILTAVQTLDNAISGNEMQVDVVAALPAGTNAIGKVGHDITGIGHGVTTVTTAGTDVALAGSTACKRVMIQSQTDNTGLIAVGASGVDATVATGTGVILYPGDIIDFDIDNLNDVYIDSTVNGEGVRYTYWT